MSQRNSNSSACIANSFGNVSDVAKLLGAVNEHVPGSHRSRVQHWQDAGCNNTTKMVLAAALTY
jgi:hypothetical protein